MSGDFTILNPFLVADLKSRPRPRVHVPATAEAAACSVEAMRNGKECEACQ